MASLLSLIFANNLSTFCMFLAIGGTNGGTNGGTKSGFICVIQKTIRIKKTSKTDKKALLQGV